MRGEVIHYDDNQGVGYISGDDGERYGFTRADMRQLVAVGKGTRVDFQRDGVNARDIFVMAGYGRPAATPPAGQPAAPGAPPQVQTDPDDRALGLFSYFRRALAERYTDFRRRARRKEYWGFVLFTFIGFVIVGAIASGVEAALGTFDTGDVPYVLMILLGIYWLAVIVPSIAVTVRRLHDIGLSGWFFLLQFIPYVGGLIIFVMMLMPSQKNPNKWGDIPAGAV